MNTVVLLVLIILLSSLVLALLLVCLRLRQENRGLRHELASAPAMTQSAPRPVSENSLLADDAIDLAAGLKMTGGKPKLFHKFLGDFREKYRDFTAQSAIFMGSAHFGELERLAHTLKGNAAMLGFKELSAASALLETGAREASLAACEDALGRVNRAFLPVLNAIQQALGGASALTGQPGTSALIQNPGNLALLLAEALDLLDRGEFGAHAVLESIQNNYDISSCQNQFCLVRQAVENGDYDEACQDLQLLIAQGSIK